MVLTNYSCKVLFQNTHNQKKSERYIEWDLKCTDLDTVTHLQNHSQAFPYFLHMWFHSTPLCNCLWCRSKEPLKDSVVSTYEEHEDSVYAAEWSSADPWLFASLSYDGRLVINRVPRALKYRILLWEGSEVVCECMYTVGGGTKRRETHEHPLLPLDIPCTLSVKRPSVSWSVSLWCKYTVLECMC